MHANVGSLTCISLCNDLNTKFRPINTTEIDANMMLLILELKSPHNLF